MTLKNNISPHRLYNKNGNRFIEISTDFDRSNIGNPINNTNIGDILNLSDNPVNGDKSKANTYIYEKEKWIDPDTGKDFNGNIADYHK